MRVLVCCDSIAALSSGRAGRAVAAGWAGARTAVMPAGAAGAGFLSATAEALGVQVRAEGSGDRLVRRAAADDVAAVALSASGGDGAGAIPYEASSAPLGRAVRDLLDERRGLGGTVLVDLVADDVHDGGAGLLAALGATADVPLTGGVAALTGLTRLDLGPARQLLGSAALVGVVPADQRDRPLLGLRGISSVRGRAAGDDPAAMLAADAALARLAEGAGLTDQPGAGACGGTGLAVLALGGRLTTGPELALAGAPAADLVVTGCTVFDFASRGGEVVTAAARAAERLLSPCIVVAGEVLVGGREMRAMGIEAAYPVHRSSRDAPTGGDVTATALTALATRVARSWRW
jgi:glycerate kinase